MNKTDVDELMYPHVVHCETEEQHRKLKKFLKEKKCSHWDSRYTYYLIGAIGIASTRGQYANSSTPDKESYIIHEFDEIDFGDTKPNYPIYL